ncbi:cytosolic Fe-S cluster assembly factor NUBP2 isoform X2 [Penaeus vannamei]|uniref:cytosolic Fe-S cluster assembly factor NUBP2 isoform X2 n=2 Tax=Penaeus vannamei TaxID=6689 RepID=UPI000F68B7FA|nr:cytosolic Fe-S cluster assembly factor NUBP2 homolog [Penaeus vannamei]
MPRDIEDIQECPADMRQAGKASVCQGCPGQELCLSEASQVDPDQQLIDTRLKAIKHKILVMSGKGGVGKSSIAVMLAQILAHDGRKVGLLDVDICGPSVPSLLKIEAQPVMDSQWGWKPIVSPQGNIKTLSVGSLLSSGSQAVVWRGPRKTALIRRMIKDTLWGRLDDLVIDTPPGTSDEHLTIIKLLASTKPDGAVIITAPQKMSAGVVSREIRFCQKMGLPILGIIENLSGFCCPCCSEVSQVFSSGAGKYLAEKYSIPFLGSLPIDPSMSSVQQRGLSMKEEHPHSGVSEAMSHIKRRVIEAVEN